MSSNPKSSKYFILYSADATIPLAVCPYLFKNSFSSEPAFTPMRIGILRAWQAFTTSATFSLEPMFPGFIRMQSTTSAAISANLWLK